MPIQCKVAQILSGQELVITAGSEDGVEEGMIFHVMGDLEVKDPDTGEVLDEMPFVKVRLKASFVRPKISLAKTFSEHINPFSVSDALRMSVPERFEYVQKEGVKAKDKTIYVGDPVTQHVRK
ncbi:MAG: hypothetical protein OXL96_24685 [Candidatus Poribacteria bacterium]|nr:hypothetical protein [Candidatus Poribacteria bacterium]